MHHIVLKTVFREYLKPNWKCFHFQDDLGGEEGEGEERKPTPIEARIAQYEKPLTKGHRTTIKDRTKDKDPDKVAKRRTEKRERSQVDRI